MSQSSAAFWDKMAARYAAMPVKDGAAYTDTLTRTGVYLAPDSQVLEIGGGTGSTALRLAGQVGHILTTDISPNMIATAQAKVTAANVTNITCQVGDVHDLDLPLAGYDAVIAFNLLHLMPDYAAAMHRVAALLKSGGVFVSKSAVLKKQAIFIKPMITVMRWLGKAPQVVFFSTSDLEGAMTDAGLEIVESATIPDGSRNCFIVARKRA